MTTIIILYTLIVLLLDFYLFYATRLPRTLRLMIFPVIAIIVLALGTISLGKPIPSLLLMGKDIEVKSIVYEQGVAIYVTGVVVGEKTPTLIAFPWTEKTASDAASKQAQGKIRIHIGPKKNGSKGNNEDGQDDDQGDIHITVEPMPQKDGE